MVKKQKNLKVVLCSLLIVFAVTFLVGQSHLVAAATKSTKVALNTSTAYLIPGETTTLKVTGTTQKVIWTSSNKDILTVTSAGKVKAVSDGIAYIKATVNNKTYKCKVTVFYPPQISMEESGTEIIVNGTGVSLKPVSYRYSEAQLKKVRITYKVYGNSGVKVSNTGKVTATKAGDFKIAAFVHGKKIQTIKMTAMEFKGFAVSEVQVPIYDEQLVKFAGNVLLPYSEMEIVTGNSKVSEGELGYYIEEDSEIYHSDGIYVKSYIEGTTTLKVTMQGVTRELKVIVGDGYQELAPVDAIKNNDFTGYSGIRLKTLTEIRKFFDENNMFSSALTDREKVTIIQKYLNSGYSGELADDTYHGNISAVFFTGSGICSSYTETFCFLCECLDIEVYYCIGTSDNGDGSFNGHGWNKVKIDGTWYYIDTYWNAGLNNFKYFLSETLWSNHKLRDEGTYDEMAGSVGSINYHDSLN